MSVKLTIFNRTRKSLPFNKHLAARWIGEEISKRRTANKNYTIELLVVGTQRIRTLNNRYRHKNQATDVLSFPIETRGLRYADLNERALGSIVLCLEIAEKQARQAGSDINTEIEKLVRHSTKHLLGIHHKE